MLFIFLFFSIVNSGAYRIINGTCAHTDSSTSTLAQEGKCPVLRDVTMACKFNTASTIYLVSFTYVVIMFLLALVGT